MEYLVMECGLSYAVVMDQDGRILKVPNLGYTVGQTLEDVVLLPERPAKATIHKRIARWGTMVWCDEAIVIRLSGICKNDEIDKRD